MLIETDFDRGLLGMEAIQGAVPALELARLDRHSRRGNLATLLIIAPYGLEAAPLSVADIVALQPVGQGMLTAGADQPVGDENEGTNSAKGTPSRQPGGSSRSSMLSRLSSRHSVRSARTGSQVQLSAVSRSRTRT